MVDLLLLLSPDGVDQLDQLAVEHRGRLTHELFLRLLALVVSRIAALRQLRQLQRSRFDIVGVDGVEQTVDDARQLNALRCLSDPLLLIGIELAVQASKAARQRADGIGIARRPSSRPSPGL